MYGTHPMTVMKLQIRHGIAVLMTLHFILFHLSSFRSLIMTRLRQRGHVLNGSTEWSLLERCLLRQSGWNVTCAQSNGGVSRIFVTGMRQMQHSFSSGRIVMVVSTGGTAVVEGISRSFCKFFVYTIIPTEY